MRYFIKGEALCFAFLFSASVFAQAPVSDINQTSVANNGALNSTLPVSSLEERVAVLERIIKSRNVMQQNLQTQLDDMQYEVDELRGTVELHTNQLEKVLQRQRELYLEIDKRVEALRSSTQLQVPTTTPDPRESRVPSQPKLGESESYDKAVNLILKTREYDKAIPAFREFLQAYPTSEFADNAHYWLGQLLFNKKEWTEAESSFLTVVDNFADSTKRADAMLKLGVIKQNLGKNSQATVWFDRVVSEYPNSSAAKLARSRQQ